MRFCHLHTPTVLLLHTLVARSAAHAPSRRDEPAGSECSDEGQWNCMTDSWQRCASGRWSVVVDCAEGTVCAPAGLTNDFSIEHDGSVHGSSNSGSGGLGRGMSSAAYAMLCCAVVLWFTIAV
ncbi:hypothetical protein B0I35DRAFT_456504 [Stachybotrys elegans]|uniref:Extracellular membrane protein CFEM domain-containing protein n=1 Tax=Stachybotrys elegans TaxID=80388 RepID=A0A8K0T2M2_9HYPO|nr:hypothetical protein B0I35DRAFT_456504 [Stachybotrys elegans]